jgi:hypothetical protein
VVSRLVATPVYQASARHDASANASSADVSASAGLQFGNLILIYRYSEFTDANPTTTGFTQLAPVSTADHTLEVLWKVAGAGEPISWTVIWVASVWFELAALRISGVDTSTGRSATTSALRGSVSCHYDVGLVTNGIVGPQTPAGLSLSGR